MIIDNSSFIGRSTLKIIDYLSTKELLIVLFLTALILFIVLKVRR